jgi:hypothetical protein
MENTEKKTEDLKVTSCWDCPFTGEYDSAERGYYVERCNLGAGDVDEYMSNHTTHPDCKLRSLRLLVNLELL